MMALPPYLALFAHFVVEREAKEAPGGFFRPCSPRTALALRVQY
jgi:hypothetical protein